MKIIESEVKDQLMEAIEMFGEEEPNAVTQTAAKHLLYLNQDDIQMDE